MHWHTNSDTQGQKCPGRQNSGYNRDACLVFRDLCWKADAQGSQHSLGYSSDGLGLDAQEFLKMAFGIPKPCLGNPSRENERRGARSSTGCLLEEDDLGRMHGRWWSRESGQDETHGLAALTKLLLCFLPPSSFLYCHSFHWGCSGCWHQIQDLLGHVWGSWEQEQWKNLPGGWCVWPRPHRHFSHRAGSASESPEPRLHRPWQCGCQQRLVLREGAAAGDPPHFISPIFNLVLVLLPDLLGATYRAWCLILLPMLSSAWPSRLSCQWLEMGLFCLSLPAPLHIFSHWALQVIYKWRYRLMVKW